MDYKKLEEELEYQFKLQIPEFRNKKKEDSKLMKFFAVILFFNKRFMSGFVTTIFPNIYWPSEDRTHNRKIITLCHEFQHLLRQKRVGIVHAGLEYIFPQWLAVFSLFAILAIWFGLWWLLALVFLLALIPWPAHWRTKEELRGYTMSIFVIYHLHGRVLPDTIEGIAKQFYGPSYYYMWPNKKKVRARLESELGRIERGDYNNVEPYRTVKHAIEKIRNA